MRKLVLGLLVCGSIACGPLDEGQKADAQMSTSEALMEAPAKGGDYHAQGYYEWFNRSSSTCGSWQYFVISVPENTPNLTVASYGGTLGSSPYYGAQLYVRYQYRPTTSTYSGYSGNYYTNDESISIDNPSPGTWWIGLYAYCSYTGVTVMASF